jgi:hypothetical protein
LRNSRKSVEVKPWKPQLSQEDQNSNHCNSPNSDSVSPCHEQNYENPESPEIVTEKVRPRELKLQMESLDDDLQDQFKNRNPFFPNKISPHAKHKDSPDTNEIDDSILCGSKKLGNGSGRTIYESTSPIDSNFSTLPLSLKGPGLRRDSSGKPSLFKGQVNPPERFCMDNRFMYLTI